MLDLGATTLGSSGTKAPGHPMSSPVNGLTAKVKKNVKFILYCEIGSAIGMMK